LANSYPTVGDEDNLLFCYNFDQSNHLNQNIVSRSGYISKNINITGNFMAISEIPVTTGTSQSPTAVTTQSPTIVTTQSPTTVTTLSSTTGTPTGYKLNDSCKFESYFRG
jgi:hypothetical protein